MDPTGHNAVGDAWNWAKGKASNAYGAAHSYVAGAYNSAKNYVVGAYNYGAGLVTVAASVKSAVVTSMKFTASTMASITTELISAVQVTTSKPRCIGLAKVALVQCKATLQ
jgi:hypothetical protein